MLGFTVLCRPGKAKAKLTETQDMGGEPMSRTAHEIPEAEQRNIITFQNGILGFEDVHEYLLYHEDDSNIIWSLQAADSDTPSFIVIDPFTIVEDYHPELSKKDLASFGETDVSSLCFLVIAVIKAELSESVVNLKAPIVIDINTKQAKQIILEDSEYPIRYRLFADRK